MSLLDKGSAKRLLGSLTVLILTIAFLECALWLVSARSKAIRALLSSQRVDPLVSDPVLEYRLNPALPDNDKAGFRNASLIEAPFLIALGDSQTYGTGVSREQSWPQQLASLSGEQAYNMGVPGYGPVQEFVLMSRAVTSHPRWVAEAFYSGNDLYDAYHMVYTRNQIIDFRSNDQSTINAIDKAEAQSPLTQTIDRLSDVYGGKFDSSGGTSDDHQPIANPIRRFLSEHSRLWGLLRAVRRAVTDEPWNEQLSQARRSGGLWVPFEKGRVRTVLVPDYRFVALNMEDPRIREGLRVSIEAMRRMSNISQKSGVHFTVVLIPTKELVFFETFRDDRDGALVAVKQLANEEQQMLAEFKNQLRSSGISYVDMLPALCKSLSAGESPFFITSDGHLNMRGQKVVAAALWGAITAMGN